MQADAIEKGSKVVVIDDLLATGGESRSWFCPRFLVHKS